MAPATATGADATPNGNAKSRDHNQGNQERKYTVEQKSAVVRVRKCSATAFYDILGLEEVKKTVTDAEIKKAYRKLSLLTHPDKNGYDGADEAFKLVSRAFQILSDPEKKGKYDRFGGDPDNRFGPGAAAASSPFSGFGRSASSSRGAGGPMWEEEISPEEMFNRFFGGGGAGFGPFAGGGGLFDTGPQFVFNLGGGPGFRVHQFGGAQPRRRPREASSSDPPIPPPSLASTISNLLPLLIIFILPLLSTLFSADSSPFASSGPKFRFDTPSPPLTLHRTTTRLGVHYYVDPRDVVEYTSKKWGQLDQKAEVALVGQLRAECEVETERRDRLVERAQGWFWTDEEMMERARGMEMRACQRLEGMRSGRGH